MPWEQPKKEKKKKKKRRSRIFLELDQKSESLIFVSHFWKILGEPLPSLLLVCIRDGQLVVPKLDLTQTFYLFILLFRAAPTAYGGSQAKG